MRKFFPVLTTFVVFLALFFALANYNEVKATCYYSSQQPGYTNCINQTSAKHLCNGASGTYACCNASATETCPLENASPTPAPTKAPSCTLIATTNLCNTTVDFLCQINKGDEYLMYCCDTEELCTGQIITEVNDKVTPSPTPTPKTGTTKENATPTPTPKGSPIEVMPHCYTKTFSNTACDYNYIKCVNNLKLCCIDQSYCRDEETLNRYSGSSIDIHGSCGEGRINTAIGCIDIGDENTFLSDILRWAVGVGSGIAFLLMLYSGFMIMTAQGNPERMKAGQELMTSAIAGLILLIFSVFILKFIGVDILGLNKFGFGS